MKLGQALEIPIQGSSSMSYEGCAIVAFHNREESREACYERWKNTILEKTTTPEQILDILINTPQWELRIREEHKAAFEERETQLAKEGEALEARNEYSQACSQLLANYNGDSTNADYLVEYDRLKDDSLTIISEGVYLEEYNALMENHKGKDLISRFTREFIS